MNRCVSQEKASACIISFPLIIYQYNPTGALVFSENISINKINRLTKIICEKYYKKTLSGNSFITVQLKILKLCITLQ